MLQDGEQHIVGRENRWTGWLAQSAVQLDHEQHAVESLGSRWETSISNISRSCTQRDSTSPGPFLILKVAKVKVFGLML